MPIRRDLRKFYGKEWRKVVRPRIIARARNHCERCGKPNGAHVQTISEAMGPAQNRLYFMWWRRPGHAPGNVWINHAAKVCQSIHLPPGLRSVRVVLTVAHLNHVAGDDRDENLAALCQWCHLVNDLRHHAESREQRKDQGRPLLTAQCSATPGM